MALPAGPTKYFVTGIMAIAGLTVIWLLLDWPWAIVASLAAAWEAWTFFNQYEGDTISEVIWALTARPMVPFVFGLGVCHALSHLIQPTANGLWVAFLIGGLCGHFFFSRQ